MPYGERVMIEHVNPKIAEHGAYMPRSGQRIPYRGKPISVWEQDAKWLIDMVDKPDWKYVTSKPKRKRKTKAKGK